ncbi:MAG TPA: folate-binding protein, partial [Opitutaceae bacterium]|nr:folate-binding protein [Opitutaceae bacterium]
MNLPASCGYFPYIPAAMLHVSGEDAAAFLQGQFTNDLSGLAPGNAVYGLWLDVKGKVQADSFIVGGAAPGEFWIASLHSPGPLLRKRLEDFIIADDVAVAEPDGPWQGFALTGAEAGAWLAAEPRPGWHFPGRRGAEPAWEWLVPAAEAEQARAALAGGRALAAEEMERRRIAAGIPAVPRDLGPADLPNEGGLEAAAISYSKGCYLGQEVMARLKSRGRLRR